MASISASKLRRALEKHAEFSNTKLRRQHLTAASWFAKRGLKPHDIRQHAARLTSAAALAGAMFMSGPVVSFVSPTDSHILAGLTIPQLQDLFTSNIKTQLPSTIRPLTPDEEASISRLIEIFWGIRAYGTLEGEHLNTTYGLMGAEQHLPRFPGDTVDMHDAHQSSGITPGRGAWGYFADSKSELTDDLVQKEKYYVAVQTLYLPDWNIRTAYLREWYKYRKVLVINPANGKIIVADIADAGPGIHTGKSFGASPEVMAYLEMKDGRQRGPAVIFFVDDKENVIPLGPLSKRKE